jgi:tRNA threonylcarbamoyladenosine biosynthesis protein TsaE
MKTYKVQNLHELKKIAKKIAGAISSESKQIHLSGPLGAGKTTLIKAILDLLGVNEKHVKSPTFTIKREYISNNGIKYYHVDLYRLNEINVEELFEEDGIYFIEWSERLPNQQNKPCFKINIEFDDGDGRIITIMN